MHIKDVLTDDDAVSPVIGVILMVAITVILAAVIATFVLGLGDQVSSTAPQATFGFDYDSDAGDLTITHTGGASISDSELTITGATDLDDEASWTDTEVTAGSSTTVGVEDGDTVRVVWESPEGGQSATLQTWEGPGA